MSSLIDAFALVTSSLVTRQLALRRQLWRYIKEPCLLPFTVTFPATERRRDSIASERHAVLRCWRCRSRLHSCLLFDAKGTCAWVALQS